MPVSADVVLAVRELLDGRPRSRAMKGADLARAASGMVGRILVVRRVQEAIDNLRSQGMAICSLSSSGYWHGQTAEEVEESLAEAERRARGALRQRRLLRTRLAELRGQVRIGEGVQAMHSPAQYPLPLQHVPPPAQIVRRVACPGTDEQPCPAHAWWYEGRRVGAGAGRRRKRCHVCAANQQAEAKRRARRAS